MRLLIDDQHNFLAETCKELRLARSGRYWRVPRQIFENLRAVQIERIILRQWYTRFSRLHGEVQSECGSSTDDTVDADMAACRLDKAIQYAETKSAAAIVHVCCEEGFEDSGPHFGVNATTSVLH